MNKNEYEIKKRREEALSKVGYIGILLSEGETGKNNAVFPLAFILNLALVVLAFLGMERFIAILIPLITLLIGRFTKD